MNNTPTFFDYYYQAAQISDEHFPPKLYAHTHDFYEIYLYQQGSIRFSVQDVVYTVKKGDVIIVPPYTIHHLSPVTSDQAYNRIFMYITQPCLRSFQFNENSLLTPIQLAAENKRYHFHISDPDDFVTIENAILDICNSEKTDTYGAEFLNRSRILLAMTLINKHINKNITPIKTQENTPIIEKVITYLNEHYQENITLEKLTSKFFINKDALTKQFKKQTSVTIHHYLIVKRIGIAKQKITEGELLSTLYLDVGFADYSTFYRAFKSVEHISPKEFAALVNKGISQ